MHDFKLKLQQVQQQFSQVKSQNSFIPFRKVVVCLQLLGKCKGKSGQHGVLVASTVASQQEGPWFKFLQEFLSHHVLHLSFFFGRDALIVSSVNMFTSILAGFVIFSAIGYMGHIHNLPVDKIATDGKHQGSKNCHTTVSWLFFILMTFMWWLIEKHSTTSHALFLIGCMSIQ